MPGSEKTKGLPIRSGTITDLDHHDTTVLRTVTGEETVRSEIVIRTPVPEDHLNHIKRRRDHVGRAGLLTIILNVVPKQLKQPLRLRKKKKERPADRLINPT